ncbi:hypothetical protein HE1_00688 [Holospora elegans E1]|uniref:Uncharacterized protein n=1 Tax=Holospora elegans E1 TaxID=1427503 RepID=A0A023DY21_9PROT|nr:hypothetical protein HE1_00688 [Holospora elegans E1]
MDKIFRRKSIKQTTIKIPGTNDCDEMGNYRVDEVLQSKDKR